ncbi:hypothetical protein MMC13_005065 [Lambiella insularis]|nr:hypothetical protein [Lambiella insularis]
MSSHFTPSIIPDFFLPNTVASSNSNTAAAPRTTLPPHDVLSADLAEATPPFRKGQHSPSELVMLVVQRLNSIPASLPDSSSLKTLLQVMQICAALDSGIAPSQTLRSTMWDSTTHIESDMGDSERVASDSKKRLTIWDNTKHLENYLLIFSKFFFNDGLGLDKIELEVTGDPIPRTKPGTTFGTTTKISSRKAQILIYNRSSTEDPIQRRQQILGTLLHEMCHALFVLYVKRKDRTDVEKRANGIGLTGYGHAWVKVMEAIEKRIAERPATVPEMSAVLGVEEIAQSIARARRRERNRVKARRRGG